MNNKGTNLKEKLRQALASTIRVISDDLVVKKKNKEIKESEKFDFFELNNLSNKTDFIKSMKLTDDELMKEYNINSKSGAYKQDDLYEINHLVFPIKDDKSNVISEAKRAYSDLENNKSIANIIDIYSLDDDTKTNKGYLGKLTLGAMPTIIKSNIIDTTLFRSHLCDIGRKFNTNKSPYNLIGHRSGYTGIYYLIFNNLRDKKFNFEKLILEKNGSSKLWREFF